ncbi:hypothetical protein DNTS_022865 [Danionella cerebrum]|uniref:Uncharacterized protein n=1 Tax=Danionella cerebrum TaxID=2873325 RepID=A0A553QU90_9TELE|nr:hypothetical protein DNTS_022865 [Danionella translucida]
MESPTKQLSARLLSLLNNGRWEAQDIVTLFEALLEDFGSRDGDFETWMMKLLHQVEIHKIRASELNLNLESRGKVEDEINKKAKTRDKTLNDIISEIKEQGVVDHQTLEDVRDIVSSVQDCLDASTAPTLEGIKLKLFKLCTAVKKAKKYKPRLSQMVSWCILVLSKSSQLVQVGTGEGKSCIVAMFAAYQVMGKEKATTDIISSSPVLAERDAGEWDQFYRSLNITVDVNTKKSTDKELKKCYECQVVYGTTESFAGDFLRQHFQGRVVRPQRDFQSVIVDEVDSLMLDKGLEVVYLNSDMPLMERLNGLLSEIWLIINQLKHLETGEILGPIQTFSQILLEIMNENKDISSLRILQAAVDTGILPQSLSKRKGSQPMEPNVLKQLDDASVEQMVGFLTRFVQNFPEYSFKLFQESSNGTLETLNHLSFKGANKNLELCIIGNGKCRVVYFEEASLVKSLGTKIKLCFEPKAETQPKSNIPGLEDLINGKIETWIKNALEATKMTLGQEYILHDDGVAPVDYKCTGVVQNNMKWGDGLQQFLEMKHKTKLSNMSLITNFMSNVGLFRKYKDQIYGVTGTLGEETEINMLKKLYQGLKTCEIPSFKRRKLYELEGMVTTEEDEWMRTICDAVKHQVSPTVYRGPRAALVICETINRTTVLRQKLADTIPQEKLKLYVNNNMNNATVIDKSVKAGDVIIATNLAGRGTDLKVENPVNESGGLFVLQTFLPLNVRVENQAFGRTARQGSPGSAQLIMCTHHFSNSIRVVMGVKTLQRSFLSLLKHLSASLISHLSVESAFEETVSLYLQNRSVLNKCVMISTLDLFLNMKSAEFSTNKLDEVKGARNLLVNMRLSRFLEEDIPKILKKEELFSFYLDFLGNLSKNQCDDVIVSSLHECWGLWLLMHFSDEDDEKMMKEKLKEDLLKATQKLLNKQSPSSMVYYYIRSGNCLREKGQLSESIEMYTKALEDGASGEIIPLYNRALATIKNKNSGYVTQALEDLEKADKAVDSYKSNLQQMYNHILLSSPEQTAKGSLLLTQFQVKCIVVDLLQKNIQDAVMKLRRADSRGGDVSLTEKLTYFLPEGYLISPRFLKEVLMEVVHVKSLGVDTIFTLDTMFSLSGLISKILTALK